MSWEAERRGQFVTQRFRDSIAFLRFCSEEAETSQWPGASETQGESEVDGARCDGERRLRRFTEIGSHQR